MKRQTGAEGLTNLLTNCRHKDNAKRKIKQEKKKKNYYICEKSSFKSDTEFMENIYKKLEDKNIRISDKYYNNFLDYCSDPIGCRYNDFADDFRKAMAEKSETSTNLLHKSSEELPEMRQADIKILDACCGSRMFWFDRREPHTTYIDIRDETLTLCDGRTLEVKPDIVADCRKVPFADNTFNLIVFDPPHLRRVGENSWMQHKYGKLPPDWKSFLRDSMQELMRVLKPGGTLIFKWNEHQIKVSRVLEAIPYQPLFGHQTRRNDTTIWMTFVKFSNK